LRIKGEEENMSVGNVAIDDSTKALIQGRVQILRERMLRELRYRESEGCVITVGTMITKFSYIIGSAPVWWQLLKMRNEHLITFDGESNWIRTEARIRLV
jgi:hypothetical protein